MSLRHRGCRIYTFLFDVETEPVQTLRACTACGRTRAEAHARAQAAVLADLPPGAEIGLVDSSSGRLAESGTGHVQDARCAGCRTAARVPDLDEPDAA